jgi:hypothetical protein
MPAAGVVAVLKRVVAAIRARWPAVPIAFRGDSGFAVPALYDYLEQEQISYTIGLLTNERLKSIAAPLLDEAHAQATETGEKVRLFGETQYAAGSWAYERRVVYKAGWLSKGGNRDRPPPPPERGASCPLRPVRSEDDSRPRPAA